MKKIIIYILAFVGFSFLGCETDNEPIAADSLELSAEQLSFMNEYTGEQQITITSTNAWSAQSDKGWCKLSTAGGKAGISHLKISVEPNTDINSREAIVSISTNNMSKQVKVVQLGEKEEILLLQPQTTIDGHEHTVNVLLTTNVKELSVSIPSDVTWIKVMQSAKSSLGKSGVEKNIIFSIGKNSTLNERTAAIIFSGGTALSKTFTIVQQPLPTRILNFTNVNIDENIGMWANGMEIKFDVETNVNYEIIIDDDWLKNYTQNENNFVISMPENTGAARSGKIIIMQPDSDPLVSDTLTVRQLGTGEEFIGSRHMDSLSLAAVYRATDMANWSPINGRSWAFNLEQPLNQWQSIKLNSEGRVIRWEISGTQKADTNFRYTIPAEIRNLTQLKVLNITSWNLSRITPEFGSLKQLDSLILVGNLTGEIPAELGNLTALTYLSISGNVQLKEGTSVARFCSLTGNIPESIYNLTKLQVIRINYSKIIGAISPNIKNLPNLMGIYFDRNQLSGCTSF